MLMELHHKNYSDNRKGTQGNHEVKQAVHGACLYTTCEWYHEVLHYVNMAQEIGISKLRVFGR